MHVVKISVSSFATSFTLMTFENSNISHVLFPIPDTCVSEFVEIDSTKRVKSGCDVLANNTELTEVQDVVNCTVWACAQGANVINW